jgi:hypothetical protein
MALIDAEHDDEALLAAEDQAIAAAQQPTAETPLDDLVRLLSDDPSPIPEATEAGGGSRG